MSMMLLGMALYKWGIVAAQKSKTFYVKMALIGLSIGYFFTRSGIIQNFRHEWSMEFSMFAGSMYNYIGSVGSALGYIALVMLIGKICKIHKTKIPCQQCWENGFYKLYPDVYSGYFYFLWARLWFIL